MSSGPNGKALKLRKLYHSISEVSKMTDIPAHVLRYWEGEFRELSPKKGRGGARLYQEKDIELIRNIQDLLYNKKFTISGARKQLKESQPATNGAVKKVAANGDVLGEIRSELHDILKLLDRKN